MKILCFINHFFGKHKTFMGKSSLPDGMVEREIIERKKKRKEIVEKVISQIKTLGDVDIMVCGIEGYSLVPIDLDFSYIKDRPLLLIYESISKMAEYVEDYDYFINIEDDTFLPKETFENIIRFDKTSFVNEIFLPNRLEQNKKGEIYCVDLYAFPGWITQSKKFESRSIRVAYNPHSALIILSKEKFRYVLTQCNLEYRENILFNELDSAFAYFHSVFSLYRSEELSYHFVHHLDRWLSSPGEKPMINSPILLFRSYLREYVPQIFIRFYKYLKGITN